MKEFYGEIEGKSHLIKYQEKGTATEFAVEVTSQVPGAGDFTFYIGKDGNPTFLAISSSKAPYQIIELIMKRETKK